METDDVTKCRLFSQAGLCLTGRYLPTRIFMAVLVSILIFVDRRGCANLQSWPLRSLTQRFLGLRHAFLLLERGAGKNALYLRVNEFSRKVLIEDIILPLLMERGPPF